MGYIDITAAAMEEHHAEALKCVLAEDGVDGVILLSVPPTFLGTESLARSLVEAARDSKKPILTCLLAGKWVREARKILEEAKLPTFDTADRAARTMINLVKRQQYLSRLGAS
jgi:acyl-CoA synthetase (NDP forming)